MAAPTAQVEVLRHRAPSDRIEPLPAEFVRAGTDPSATFRFNPVEELKAVVSDELRLVPRSDTEIFREDLSALELYCFARLHRSRSWSELCDLTGLGRIESCVVTLALLRKGIVTTVPRGECSTTPAADTAGWEEADAARGHAHAHFVLASTAIAEGNPTGAAWHLRKAIAFSPAPDYAAALEKLLATSGRRCDIHYSRIRGHLRERQPRSALGAIDAALAEFPNEAGLHNLKAVAIVASLGDIDEAVTCVRRAVHIDPFNETFQQNLDRLSERQRAGRPGD